MVHLLPTLLKWLTLSLFLGGDNGSAIPLPALGQQLYLLPWPGCGDTYSPPKSQAWAALEDLLPPS